jgi:mannose-6-phosphate isomerase-like protein (cupin superfamily)
MFAVPSGTEHNFTNTGNDTLKLFTVYSPPEHPDGVVHATKADALADPDE